MDSTQKSAEILSRLSKSGHLYAIRYRADQRAEALQAVGIWAGSLDLNFSWYDCAAMSHHIRENTLDQKATS